MSDAPRLGLGGVGLPAVDKAKAEEGVEVTVPSGRLKGVRMVVRMGGSENPHQRRFMEKWAAGEFKEVIKARVAGGTAEVDDDALLRSAARATQTPEYVAHVLIADLPDPIEIPEHVDSLDTMPPSTHERYTAADDGGYRLKKNRKDTHLVDYKPDVGVWLVERYPDLGDWALMFSRKEEQFLEERLELEGNG